jgi:glycosyltransferase involved in cell wall biosynthesis
MDSSAGPSRNSGRGARAVVLYRPSLDARSGAGQLLEMQWRGLTSAGVPALLACGRGALKFWLRTGVRARRRSVAAIDRLQRGGALIADHGFSVPRAELAFVHNLATEAALHVPGISAEAARHERDFFLALNVAATVVANSQLVAAALHRHFGLARERVTVLYPAFDSRRYSPQRVSELRDAARASLGVDAGAPLVGFVTSGDFVKRGLDLFLDCATRISAARRDAQFLVVGSKELPAAARAHPLVRGGVVRYRPKSGSPERWLAALDLFLYAARFEEFGMVVAEAQAMGVPVLTSRLVGASECLPAVYSPWLLERPEPALMTDKALALLADAATRSRLGSAAAVSVLAFDERAYLEGMRRLIAAQNRLLK